MHPPRARLWITIWPVAIAMALFAAACASTQVAAPAGAPGPADPVSRAGSATASRSASPPVAVPTILDFTAPQLGGGTVEGADYAGKDTAIWFWAPW